jgi:nitrogen regulatory protein P-II 1
MKLIRSVVNPGKVDGIKEALAKLDVSGLTLIEVRDHVPGKVQTILVWRGHTFKTSFFEKVEIDVVVHDDDVDNVVTVILGTARTGELGDGHVSVMPIDHRYSIRTGARDVN